MNDFAHHTYSIALRIEGLEVLPSVISAELGLAPSHTRERDEPRGTSGKFRQGLWSYSATNQSDGVIVEWTSLEDGLLSLIDELRPKHDLISRYARDFDVCWWCGHFQKSFDGGPHFSPMLFKKLADFGIPLFLDNYFSETE